MKSKCPSLLRFFLLVYFLLVGKLSGAETFDVFIANDFATSKTTYEFDVFIRSTDPAPWAFRTIQFGFTVNPEWLPAGPAPSIKLLNRSTDLAFYSPGNIQMNATPSLSAFQIACNGAGTCCTNTIFSLGKTVKVGRFSITSNSGPMNCTPINLSMILPDMYDHKPGGNVNLTMAVTKWTSLTCAPSGSVTISKSGTYTNVLKGTLLSSFNNMAPQVSGPQNIVVCEGSKAEFNVTANSNKGQNSALTYQWNDNGIPIQGEVSSQLSLRNVNPFMSGHFYTCIVEQCNLRTSFAGKLTVLKNTNGLPYSNQHDFGTLLFPFQNNASDPGSIYFTNNSLYNFQVPTAASAHNYVLASNVCAHTAGNVSVNENPDNLFNSTVNKSISKENTDAFSVYPNPTSGKTTLMFTAFSDDKYALKVVDALGRLVIHKTIFAFEGFNSTGINLENAPKGMYFVSVQTEGGEAKTMQLVVE
jgi:hypothetical protein